MFNLLPGQLLQLMGGQFTQTKWMEVSKRQFFCEMAVLSGERREGAGQKGNVSGPVHHMGTPREVQFGYRQMVEDTNSFQGAGPSLFSRMFWRCERQKPVFAGQQGGTAFLIPYSFSRINHRCVTCRIARVKN